MRMYRNFLAAILGLAFVDGDAAVTQIAAGVDEGDKFRGILLKGIAGKVLAVLDQGLQILEQRHFTTGKAKFDRVSLATLAEEIGGGLDLDLSAIRDHLGLEVILIAAEPPIGEDRLPETFWERCF